MQRTLVMIRHAKSSWTNPLQSDFERPLTAKGKTDAPAMGAKLHKLGIVPDLIIASSAKRTRQTARRVAREVGYDTDHIRWEEKLYHCIPSVFEELIYEADEQVKTIFIVAHNPGITEFVNSLAPDFTIANMPTCGVVCTHVDSDDWTSFSIANKKVFLFEYPGNEHDTK